MSTWGELLSAQMRVFYGREERDPAHAELLFTTVTRSPTRSTLKPDYRPEIIR